MSFINLGKRWFWLLIHFINLYLWPSANSAMSFSNRNQIEAVSDDEWDDFEYDSTWEDEIKAVKKKGGKPKKFSHRNMYAARDMQKFRHSCQNLDYDDDVDQADMYMCTKGNWYSDMQDAWPKTFYNLEFYKGCRNSEPDNECIDAFHNKWKGSYDELERVHSYIQWLFPIQERGMNWQAHVLTKEEIKLFRKDAEAKIKLVKSYELMLDFYGIRLVDKKTGEVERAENWIERFKNLNRNTHNNLRITRIVKCLGTLGFEHYQAKLVKFFLHETLVEKTLPNVKESVLDYFMFAVLNKSERKDLIRFAFEHFEPREEFVWGPKKILSVAAVNKHGENKKRISAENKSVSASGEDRTLDEGVGRRQEKGGVYPPSCPTSYNAEYSKRERNAQEGVCKSVSSREKKEREGTPCTNINTAEGTRKDSSEQESVSSQSSLKDQCVTGMKNRTIEQSSTENDQMQSELAPSDMPIEVTSNESDETMQDVSETHQVSSNSASDEERGKNGSDVQQHESYKMGLNI